MIPYVLDALADKGAVVRDSAQYALDALFANLKPEAMVVGLLPVLTQYLSKVSGKWQGAVGAYELMGRMADKAKLGMGSKEEEKAKEVLRESMGRKLAGLIPAVETGMHDLKAEVRTCNHPIKSVLYTNFLEGLQASCQDNDVSHNPLIK